MSLETGFTEKPLKNDKITTNSSMNIILYDSSVQEDLMFTFLLSIKTKTPPSCLYETPRHEEDHFTPAIRLAHITALIIKT